MSNFQTMERFQRFTETAQKILANLTLFRFEMKWRYINIKYINAIATRILWSIIFLT